MALQIDDSIMLFPVDKNDGNVSIRLAEDKLEVRADFYPPGTGGNPLGTNEVAAALNRYNIIYGLLWDNIQKSLVACNLDRKAVKDIPVARGNPPVQETLEYFERNPKLERTAPAYREDRLDYREFSPFVIVKKGQILARLHPRREGRDGKDIYGNTIVHGTVKPEGVSAGENTRSDGKYIYADINGQFVEEKGKLRVQDVLEIKGGVDYHTGNIAFPGDIRINGPVSDGFRIYSGGSITIKQTFDVTEAIAKSDLSVAGGIIGRGRATVKVGGGVKTKFIENCKIACRKTISVEADIINSSVYTMERVEMGEKGMILGGEIYAVQGVRAAGIGKKSGRATTIHCGIDFTALQERDRLNHNLKIIKMKLDKLRALLDEIGESGENSEHVRLEEAAKQLEEERQKTGVALVAVLGRLNANDEASVEVTGNVAQGTLIEICQIALFVTDPLVHVRIRLDRAAGKIVSENLG
jgi:uncharacterized protein (DUF342 family)